MLEQIYCSSTYIKSYSLIENCMVLLINKWVQLIAANKTHIKQLGTVRLRVHVRNKEVCLFYVVPDMCYPSFGLPDLTSMKSLSFDIPLKSDWEVNNSVNSVDSNLTKQTVLASYHDVFNKGVFRPNRS